MPSEKTSMLKSKDYKIDGNLLRAFYDVQHKLVFVLDSSISEIKPNVLLVMASRGDRKWDDVLANDYNMDLELVRPKKNNKYQKLDIEYDGLVVYDNLIRAYDNNGDVKSALRELQDFREMSARRSASERLAAASAVAENARETIERTGDTIIELQAKIKAVRAKITGLRRNVGREPTKQSAAKILRAEAQLDALNDKLERAKKRMENANKRLLNAEDDIAAARAVLDLVGTDGGDDNKKFKTVETTVAAPDRKQPVKQDDQEIELGDDEIQDDDVVFKDNVSDDDTDDTDTSDVKPLFDQDPQIIDEKIAFKPISFDEEPEQNDDGAQTELSVKYDDDIDNLAAEPTVQQEKTDSEKTDAADKPTISFEPPKPIMDVVSVPNVSENNDAELDEIFAGLDDDEDDVEDGQDKKSDTGVAYDENISENVDTQSHQDLNIVPVLETETKDTEIVAAPDEIKMESEINVTPVIDAQPDKENATVVAPAAKLNQELVRPASPMAGNTPVVNVPVESESKRKPNVLYYVLLLVLIALSVFTLWLYQRSNVVGDVVPTLVPETETVVQTQNETPVVQPETVVDNAQDDESTDDSNPFVASGEQVDKPGNSAMEKVAEESFNKLAEAADIPVESEPQENVPDTEEKQESGETEQEPVVNKPEYNVTQEKVFTSDEPDVVGGGLCDGDIAPDANGCCPGETYSVVDGQNVCCPDDGGDCFPPVF